MSTPASIKEAFVNAKTFQEKKKDTKSFVSVVVLDEVGLAETSPYLPLKALHPLLEDGTEGSGTNDQVHFLVTLWFQHLLNSEFQEKSELHSLGYQTGL